MGSDRVTCALIWSKSLTHDTPPDPVPHHSRENLQYIWYVCSVFSGLAHDLMTLLAMYTSCNETSQHSRLTDHSILGKTSIKRFGLTTTVSDYSVVNDQQLQLC